MSSAMTSASRSVATVSPRAPASNWIRATARDLCVLMCGRQPRPCSRAYRATRAAFARVLARSTKPIGVSIVAGSASVGTVAAPLTGGASRGRP